MARAADLDLTGHWSGIYNYPRTLPSTPFEAVIRDSGGFITGETEEPGAHGGTLHATIEGRRRSSEVRFRKAYDELPQAAHPVEYEGIVAEGGDEIHGRWQIGDHWSGTFLMVRDGGAKEEAAELEGAEVRA